jgi:hypothetical protein
MAWKSPREDSEMYNSSQSSLSMAVKIRAQMARSAAEAA